MKKLQSLRTGRKPASSQRPAKAAGCSKLQFLGIQGFTLIEILVVIGIITIIVGIAIAALSTSKSDSDKTAGEAMAKVLNQARDRAIIKGLVESRDAWNESFGNDTVGAVQFLKTNSLVDFKQTNL